MPHRDELLKSFYALFGQNGGDWVPGNVGKSRTAANVCRAIMNIEHPILFDYFEQWNNLVVEKQPLSIARHLVRFGQWEGAWALAQLHYDQLVKREAQNGSRQHKGHALCYLALVAQEIGSPSLTRHYALLATAGDVSWEHKNPSLKDGGLAPTILERYESHQEQCQWRDKLRRLLHAFGGKPVYLESLLASRWFSKTYVKHITSLAEVKQNCPQPFADVLLDSVEASNDVEDTTTGTRFEAAAGLLLSATPGFEVDSGRRMTDEQIDLVLNYTPEHWAPIGLEQGSGLVECKSSKGPVKARELRDFGAKCLFHRVRFGVLVARAGTTAGFKKFENPQNAELVRRRFQLDGLTLLVLTMTELRGHSRELRGIQGGLSADHKQLVFGPVP